MSILINLNASRLQQQFGDAAVDAVAREKVRQLLRVSRYNFRDDTGALRRTIRQERGGIVAIGDRAHTYWQHVLRFSQGRWDNLGASGAFAGQLPSIAEGPRRRAVRSVCYSVTPVTPPPYILVLLYNSLTI